MSSLYNSEIDPLWDFCKYFLPVCGLSFNFVYGFFCYAKSFKFNGLEEAQAGIKIAGRIVNNLR